jgi:hypothetical protein
MTTFASLKIVRVRTDYASKHGVPEPRLLNAAPAECHRLAKQIRRYSQPPKGEERRDQQERGQRRGEGN